MSDENYLRKIAQELGEIKNQQGVNSDVLKEAKLCIQRVNDSLEKLEKCVVTVEHRIDTLQKENITLHERIAKVEAHAKTWENLQVFLAPIKIVAWTVAASALATAGANIFKAFMAGGLSA